jgi:hypothetical protein
VSSSVYRKSSSSLFVHWKVNDFGAKKKKRERLPCLLYLSYSLAYRNRFLTSVIISMSSARLPNPGTAASGRSSSPPASLHQTIAFLLLYPRLLYLVALPPLAILSVPLLFYAFNALTAGYALAALLFAAGLYGAGRLLLASVAETPEAIAKGVARNQIRLPLFCFVTSVGFVRFLVHFLVGDRFAFYPSASVLANTFGRVAVCVLLWEGATLVRYVGPPSLGTSASRLSFACTIARSLTRALFSSSLLAPPG